jgi:XTP/dITP diphosphohydrolase
MELFVATTNPGKLRDFSAAASAGVAIAALPGLADFPVPVEDADSFEGNARLKAEAYSRLAPGLLVVADDSGIVVDALGGAPGVRSARYAADEGYVGLGTPDECNLACLLERAAGIRPRDRQARYRCVLAAARSGEVIATAAGEVEGLLLTQRRGRGGFGYDPLFLAPPLWRSMAELDLAERLEYSHRGRALRRLLKVL